MPYRAARRIAALFAILAAAPAPARAFELQVRVLNVAGTAGSVRVEVCPQAQWLQGCAITAHAAARHGITTVAVPNVPPGIYGIVAFHDANDDGEVNQNILGIPTEGVGFSRDAPARFSAPRFADAALRLEGPATIDIRLHWEPDSPGIMSR